MTIAHLSAAQLGTLESLEPLAAEHLEIGSIIPEGDMLAGERLVGVDRDEHGKVIATQTEPAQHSLAGVDEELEQDLAVIGVSLTPDVERSLSTEHREATASRCFRHVQRLRAVIAETERAKALELAMVTDHYDRQLAGPRSKVARILAFIEDLARITKWEKRRSIATPFGRYGVKKTGGSVARTNEAELLAWAKQEKPEFVRVTITLPLLEARQYLTDAEMAAAKADVEVEWGRLKATLKGATSLPPGVATTEERDEPFAEVVEG